MNINIQLKTLVLLCILHATNIGASAPAKPYEASSFAKASADRLAKYGQAVIPASLQKELKRIEGLPDYKVLTEVLPYSKDKAEQYLRNSEDKLKDSPHLLVSAQAEHRRSGLKYCAIEKELTSCLDGALKQTLQIELDEARNQLSAHRQEELRCADNYIKNQPVAAYSFLVYNLNAFSCQASILLARTQNLEKKESQWQKEKAQLQAALNGYQLLEDGLQIEGVPNVPGGVKPKLKRSGSF